MSYGHLFLFVAIAALSGYIAGCQAGQPPDSYSKVAAREFRLVDPLGNVRMQAFLSGAEENGLASGSPVLTIRDPMGRVLATYSFENPPRRD